ncbi:MAG: hypothetical protein ACOYJL_01415 [Tractidigestivibacter sp.]|jgi:hypothetical protein|uniref:hypothetical protein n=1 Tax=Tractidigestivibacter sp. TaxID=2847320 RepID=UPI003D92587D
MANESSDGPSKTPKATRGALYEEHLALRASFTKSEENGLIYPTSYDGEDDLLSALGGALVSDLTGSTYRLVSGSKPQELCEMAFCAKKLEVGECAFEPALTGDGSITSVPLLARTGAHEYVALDPTERGSVVAGWVSFLAGISQDGRAPFEGTTVEDASAMLVPLFVAGRRASELVADYVPNCRAGLPRAGRLLSVMLDGHIPSIVGSVPMGGPHAEPAYVIFVQPGHARVMWRSLLSFNWATPMGRDAVRNLWDDRLPWAERLSSTDVVEFGEDELKRWGLLRDGSDFVGSRGI